MVSIFTPACDDSVPIVKFLPIKKVLASVVTTGFTIEHMKWKFNIKKISILSSGLASLGAILASSCCIIPIVLFNLGISGAWMANLSVLQPYRIYFITVAILLFMAGLFLFIRSNSKTEKTCNPKDGKRIKRMPIMLAITVILIVIAIIWPAIEPYLLRVVQ